MEEVIDILDGASEAAAISNREEKLHPYMAGIAYGAVVGGAGNAALYAEDRDDERKERTLLTIATSMVSSAPVSAAMYGEAKESFAAGAFVGSASPINSWKRQV